MWSDERVRELARSFVPCADEVGMLQNEGTGGPEAVLFRKIAEQGHYGGRTKPTSTRQGIYAAAPSGLLLASVNTHDPRQMAEMLEKALAKWKALDRAERLGGEELERNPEGRPRLEARYPEGGLVLQVFSRDVDLGQSRSPHDEPETGSAWNADFAWFTREEAASMVPDEPETGATREVPPRLARRLARRHILDNVLGQTRAFGDEHVKEAKLVLTVVGREGDRLRLRIEGETLAVEKGTWQLNGWREPAVETERGIETKIRGRAVWNPREGRFDSFEMVAFGLRSGGTEFNVRSKNLGPAPIAFAFRKAATDEGPDRVAPAHAWGYFE